MSHTEVRWRKSSRSSDNGQCVEVVSGVRAVRDSKNPGGGVVLIEGCAAAAFMTAVKSGKFDA